MRHSYKTQGTCSSRIDFDLDGNVVHNIVFMGGCNGNLKAISSILDGYTVEEIEAKVLGIRCGFKQTSCSDQLAHAVRAAYNEENNIAK